MLDDFNFGGETLNDIENPPTQNTNKYQSNYGNSNPSGYSGPRSLPGNSTYDSGSNNGGYRGGSYGGGGNTFKRKPEVIEEPYLPVTIYINRDFPDDVKDNLLKVANKLVSKGYTVRYTADEPSIHNALQGISKKNTEAYVPWKGFNEIESRHYWNTLTAKHIAQTNFPAWEKVPNAIQSMLARDVRTLFGDKNNSITMGLITWSPDGATKVEEVNKDTGRASFIIRLAAKNNFDVINIGKEGAANAINRRYIGGDIIE